LFSLPLRVLSSLHDHLLSVLDVELAKRSCTLIYNFSSLVKETVLLDERNGPFCIKKRHFSHRKAPLLFPRKNKSLKFR